MSTVIKIENLSKQYRLGQVGTGTLSHDLNRWWHRVRGKEDPYLKVGDVNDRSRRAGSEYVWALKDINFEVEQGEVLGIIGKNGAGKSTLLKILSKVTGPTTGRILAKGRIASLLEVGTGFHPELTGRENIYLNGTILGMTRAEVTRKLDEIVDFAGVARYLDTPVKRYSSGMTVRLGFAVAAHLEPDILIVDEVLAVGDAEFQKKAIGKMQKVSKEGGRTVLFVSHNMGSVRNICKKALFLKNGFIDYDGYVEDAIRKYLTGNGSSTAGFQEFFFRKQRIKLKDVRLKKTIDPAIAIFNEPFEIVLKLEKEEGNEVIGDFVIQLFNQSGVKVSSVNSAEEGLGTINFNTIQAIRFAASRMSLFPGTYFISVLLVTSAGVEIADSVFSFSVIKAPVKNSGYQYDQVHGVARVIEKLVVEY